MTTTHRPVHDTADVIAGFASRAGDVDSGRVDIRDGLRELAERGLLHGADFALIEAVAAECLSSGFALWAQRMVVEYLGHARPGAETADTVAGLRSGTVTGVTAMAAAMRDLAGIEPLPVTAVRGRDGSLLLQGRVRWASMLFPGARVVLAARLPDGERVVAMIATDDPGVSIAAPPRLLALNATESSTVRLDNVPVAAGHVLSYDMAALVTASRPTFLLLQTAFCSGLAGRALAEARARATAEFGSAIAELADTRAALRHRALAFADAPHTATHRDLLALRLAAMTTATRAVWLELATSGGQGYRDDSPTARRLREAAFLPIQSPTEAQLRWELANPAP